MCPFDIFYINHTDKGFMVFCDFFNQFFKFTYLVRLYLINTYL